MVPKVGYRGYGLTYTILCIVISYGECATDGPFCMRRPNIFKTTPFFTRRWYAIYRTSLQCVIPMVAQSPYDLYCKHQCNLHWWHSASVAQLAPAKWQWQAGDALQRGASEAEGCARSSYHLMQLMPCQMCCCWSPLSAMSHHPVAPYP